MKLQDQAWSAPLDLAFYRRSTTKIAQQLLGCFVIRRLPGELLAGRIVETEAYGADDPASHAFGGKTQRNAAMFNPGGCAYVYRSYGVHWMLNVVTGSAGVGVAVLIRALEPVAGIDAMAARRQKSKVTELCSGPGKLCQALAIDRSLDGASLAGDPLMVCAPRQPTTEPIVVTTRIGITKATDRLWRFYLAGNLHVSR